MYHWDGGISRLGPHARRANRSFLCESFARGSDFSSADHFVGFANNRGVANSEPKWLFRRGAVDLTRAMQRRGNAPQVPCQ